MNKEEEVQNIEEEVVTLRVKIIKINKNVEEDRNIHISCREWREALYVARKEE